MILLTDDEIKKLANYPHLAKENDKYYNIDELLKAQLKKILEYLDRRSFSFQPNGESAIWVISCDKNALFKEVE